MVALQHRETILAIDDSLRLRTGSPFLVVRAEYEPFIVAAFLLDKTRQIILDHCVELLHSEHIKTDLSDGLGQTELPDIPCIAVIARSRSPQVVRPDTHLNRCRLLRIRDGGLPACSARNQRQQDQ